MPNGDRAVSGIYGWSERVIGVWWAAEIVIMAAMCVIFISLSPAGTFGWLIFPLLLSGQRLYVFIAHYRGLRWPNQDGVRKAGARRRELEASPGYEALRYRNEWVEWGSVAVLFAGIALAAVPIWPLHLFDKQDPHALWLIGLMFGLIVTAPAIFVSLATLPRGRARWADFCAYWSVKYEDPGCKKTGGVVLAFALLTLVSLVGMVVTLRAHA